MHSPLVVKGIQHTICKNICDILYHSVVNKTSKLYADWRADLVLELKGLDFTLSHLRAGMADNFSKGNSVMQFPSRSILSSVTISVSFSGKMERLLLARLMLVICFISPTSSGSLVKMLPCRSSSRSWVKVKKNLLERAFILLLANVMMWMFSETVLKTLKTPSGKEMSSQFDRSRLSFPSSTVALILRATFATASPIFLL